MLDRMFLGKFGGESYWIGSITNSTFRGVGVDDIGNIYSASVNTSRLETTKISPVGDVLWQRRYGDATSSGYALANGGNQNIYVSGYIDISGKQYGVIAKYDNNGNLQWQKTPGGSISNRSLANIAVDTSYNPVIAYDGYVGAYTLTVRKYNLSSGNLIWAINIVINSVSYSVYDISTDIAGNVYIPIYHPNDKPVLFKLNNSGVLQWQKLINIGVAGSAAVTSDNNGNVYATYNNNIIKLNSSGSIIWQRKLTVSGNFKKLKIGPNGLIYVCGTDISTTPDSGVLACYNSDGALQWQRVLSHSTNAIDFNDLYITASGALHLAAQSALVKLPGDGSLTGTYGNYTYSQSSFTDTATSYTASNTSYSTNTSTSADVITSTVNVSSSPTFALTVIA